MVSKIKIIAIGKIKESYIREGIEEYLKRLKPFVKIEIIELKDEGLKKEGEKISNYLSQNTFTLDEKGKEYSSVEFASMIKKIEGELTLIIGGANGIDEEIKKKSKTISLSKMTLIHEMARLVLIEQIYRGCMINSGREYHK